MDEKLKEMLSSGALHRGRLNLELGLKEYSFLIEHIFETFADESIKRKVFLSKVLEEVAFAAHKLGARDEALGSLDRE